jgi:hypothetical protein
LNLQDQGEKNKAFRLPNGRYRISSVLDAEIRQSSGGVPAQDGRAHPIFAFLAALGGMGISAADLFEMYGASIEDGPVLARCGIRYHRPLLVEHDYEVEGLITSVTNKKSRRFGSADHIALELKLCDGGGPCAEIAITMVAPKGAAS